MPEHQTRSTAPAQDLRAFLAALIGAVIGTLLISWVTLPFEAVYIQLEMRDELPLLTDVTLRCTAFFLPWGWLVVFVPLLGIGGVAWKKDGKVILQTLTIALIVWLALYGFLAFMTWRPIGLLEQKLQEGQRWELPPNPALTRDNAVLNLRQTLN